MQSVMPGKANRASGLVINWRPIFFVVGIMLIILALFMAPPMVADLAARHADWRVFLTAGCLTLFVGVSLVLMNRSRDLLELSGRQVFLLVTAVWITTCAFAALPLAFSELDLSAADAVFEATSGITTTGATVIVGLDTSPPGILLWRSILQWLGGVGIVVTAMAILPFLRVGGMQLVRAESSDLSEKILPRAAQIASAIGLIYLALTFLCGVLYWYAGMTPFEAAAHAMTTIATGGYSTRDASIGAFGSAAIEWIAIVFMVLGALPFVLYIQVTNGQLAPLLRDAQMRWLLVIILVPSFAFALWLTATTEHLKGFEALRQAIFSTVSVVTTTGFASADYSTWGAFPLVALFFLMAVGGCTGSTSGGIKIFRFIVLFAVARAQIVRLIRPHAVFVPMFNERPLPEAAAISVMAFVFLFGLCFVVVAVALSVVGLDFITATSGALTALANVGPGLGPEIGPAGNFSGLPDSAKWLLSFTMLLGRLELFTLLILLSPGFWRA
jgi:trk system potassium uptake protein TrkH